MYSIMGGQPGLSLRRSLPESLEITMACHVSCGEVAFVDIHCTYRCVFSLPVWYYSTSVGHQIVTIIMLHCEEHHIMFCVCSIVQCLYAHVTLHSFPDQLLLNAQCAAPNLANQRSITYNYYCTNKGKYDVFMCKMSCFHVKYMYARLHPRDSDTT